jgi:sec-independent protein translocase protein TatB
MFDLTSSKLIILAVVALIVVGPKDMMPLLRTLGSFLGMLRRQADEFRAQFDDAMRQSELADLKKEVETLGAETKSALDETTRSLQSQMHDLDRAVGEAGKPLPDGEIPAASVATDDPGAIEAIPAPTEDAIPPVPPTADQGVVEEMAATDGAAPKAGA